MSNIVQVYQKEDSKEAFHAGKSDLLYAHLLFKFHFNSVLHAAKARTAQQFKFSMLLHIIIGLLIRISSQASSGFETPRRRVLHHNVPLLSKRNVCKGFTVFFHL